MCGSRRRSGTRPLIRHVRRGDHVVASLDRLARSHIDLNYIVQQITGDPTEHTEQHPRKGASIEFLKERLTFEPGHSGPMAAFQLNMMGAFAQFERELIRQRQAECIAAAKNRGAYRADPAASKATSSAPSATPPSPAPPKHNRPQARHQPLHAVPLSRAGSAAPRND